MCVLLTKPAGVPLPSLEILENCWRNNPNGAGFAIPGHKPYHAMNFYSFMQGLDSVDEMLPMIIHFRLATHGSIRLGNCHPFRDNATGVSFAHNGILDIVPDKDTTDSETAFRRILVPAIKRSGLLGRDLRAKVNGIIGGSKFAFLADNGQIVRFGHFIDDDGIGYSNTSYLYGRHRIIC